MTTTDRTEAHWNLLVAQASAHPRTLALELLRTPEEDSSVQALVVDSGTLEVRLDQSFKLRCLQFLALCSELGLLDLHVGLPVADRKSVV